MLLTQFTGHAKFFWHLIEPTECWNWMWMWIWIWIYSPLAAATYIRGLARSRGCLSALTFVSCQLTELLARSQTTHMVAECCSISVDSQVTLITSKACMH